MENEKKLYQGLVWPTEGQPGERVTLMAEDAADAERQMAELYGADAVYTLRNEEDAARPR